MATLQSHLDDVLRVVKSIEIGSRRVPGPGELGKCKCVQSFHLGAEDILELGSSNSDVSLSVLDAG